MNKRHTNKPERTRRRMTLHSSFFILSSSLIMLLVACTNDPTEDIVDVAPGTLPEGTFVIDYTASTGDASTRATAAERIRSLDYLLYESTDGTTFTLKHRRSIPDIGENTVWPLNRETMTWKQRQALKDTLNTACQYKMVFVANADAKLWDSQEVLQNVDTDNKFEDGRLVLPPRVFTENDMYYMWSNHDTPLRGSEYNKDNPAQMDILLQRMINKVEVKRNASLLTTGNANQDIENYLDKYLSTALASNGVIFESLQNKTQEFANSDVVNTAMNAADNNFKEYLPKDEQIERLLGENDIHSIRTQFITIFKTQMTDVEKVIDKVEWEKVSKVQITYKDGGRASLLKFNTESEGATDNTDPILYEMDTENCSFVFYIYGKNNATDALNNISTISFKDKTENELFNLSGPEITIEKGNQSILITCDPFKTINNEKTLNYEVNIDWESFVNWAEIVEETLANKDVFKNAALEDLNGENITFPYPCNPVIEWNISTQQQ